MNPRTRKFIGTIIIILFVCVYALTAMAIAQARFIQESAGFVQSLYYIIIGIGWVLPMLPLIAWMERKNTKLL
jgi:Protein of unknown function (DUF2842)